MSSTSVDGVRMLPALSLMGRRAFVTGSGNGLGQMIAMGLSQAGADVVLVGRRRDPLERVAGEVEAVGGTAIIVFDS